MSGNRSTHLVSSAGLRYPQVLHGPLERRPVGDRHPAALAAFKQRIDLIIEADNLDLRTRLDLRRQPVDRIDRLHPLRRAHLLLRPLVTPPENVHECLVEHAR